MSPQNPPEKGAELRKLRAQLKNPGAPPKDPTVVDGTTPTGETDTELRDKPPHSRDRPSPIKRSAEMAVGAERSSGDEDPANIASDGHEDDPTVATSRPRRPSRIPAPRSKRATPIPLPKASGATIPKPGALDSSAPKDSSTATIESSTPLRDDAFESTITLGVDDLEVMANKPDSAPPPPPTPTTKKASKGPTEQTAEHPDEKAGDGAPNDGADKAPDQSAKPSEKTPSLEAKPSQRPDGSPKTKLAAPPTKPTRPPNAQLTVKPTDKPPLSDPTNKPSPRPAAKPPRTHPVGPPLDETTNTRSTLPFGSPVASTISEADPTEVYARGSVAATLGEGSAQVSRTVVITPAPGIPTHGDSRVIPPLDTAAFYEREAHAAGGAQPDRAAAMWIEVARTGEHNDSAPLAVERALDQAAKAAPKNVAVIGQLRRMSLARRDFERVLELGERQIELGGPNPTRVAVLLEDAAVARLERGDPRGAIDRLDRALDLAPADTMALCHVVGLHLELDEAQAAVERLEQLTETSSVPRERARCLYTTGLLLEGSIRQPARALEAYGRAFEADERHLPALTGTIELSSQLGEWRTLARRLEQLAELAPGDAARLYLQAGSIYLDRVGDLEAAVRALSAASRAAPRDAAPLARLALALDARGAYPELIEVLRRLDTLTFDSGSCAALRTRIGSLAETQLGDSEAAIEAYRRALEIEPRYLPALSALGTLYQRRGAFEPLLATLAPEAEDGQSPVARAERCLEMARLLDGELGRPVDATEHVRRALELTPGAWPAFTLQRRLLRRLGHEQELGQLIDAQIGACADIKTRHHWLLELARMQAGPLAVPEDALKTYRQAREVEINRSPALELIDLLEREERFAELLELLLEEAADTRDPAEAEGYKLRAAELAEARLEEPDRALALLAEVRAANPGCVAAIRAAGRILDRLERWRDLCALYREQLDRATDDGEAAELYCRIGRLEAERLGEPAAAIDTYLQALARKPEIPAALAALERLVRHEERHDDLIDVLRRFAAVNNDPHQGADALCRAAEIAETRQDDRDRALKLYDEALTASPGFFAALYGKLGLQLRGRQRAAAASTLETLVTVEQEAEADDAAGLAELALLRHRELRLTSPPPPEELCAALADCRHVELLRPEQLRLARRGRDEALPSLLVELAEDTRDAGLAAAYYLEAAQRAELVEGDDDQHLALATQAFSASDSAPAIVWSLQRALERTNKQPELAALLEREAAEEGEFAVRIPILAEAANAHLCAGQAEDAARVARQCLTGDRHHLPSLLLLARLAEEQRGWTELASYCDQIVEACRDADNRLSVALIASDTWAHRVGETSRALASLRPALADDPGQADAFARAERLLIELVDDEQLSRLYARRINICDDQHQKIELLRLNARLLRDRLNDGTRAIGELTNLLALAPRDIDALREQADLLRQHQRWSDAVATLGTLLECTDDEAIQRRARLTQAELLLRQLHEPRRARQVLDQSLAETPDDTDARRLLVEAHIAEGSWDDARALLETLAKRPGEEERALRVWAYWQLAELARTGLREDTLRDRGEQMALETAAPDAALLKELVARFVDRGEAARLRELSTRIVERSTLVEALVPLRLALARLSLDTFGDPTAALEQLRAALVVHPEDEEARLLSARALEERGETAAAAQGYRALLIDHLTNAEAARGLARTMGMLGHPPVTAVACAVLELAGEATVAEVEQIEGLDRAGAPHGRLELTALPLSDDEADHDLLETERFLEPLLPHLASVYKLPLAATVGASHPAATAARQLGSALGLTSVQLSIESGRAPAEAGVGRPVPLRVSAELAALPEEAPFRFWVGRALAGAAGTGALLEQLDDRALERMLDALATPKPLEPALAQERKLLWRALPRKLRKLVEQAEVPQLRVERWDRFRRLERQRADRIGLLCSSNPRVALRQLELANSERLRALLEFSLSEQLSSAYRLLWTARA
ncbi:MAG: hypothetical protein CSA65_08935 [Proteobacteria bacterium]|nr:MAG: hypothetical protein CSB49_07675 [Pseudomonadota bacterium]PIE17436.1 MAG: hypothetical protein CSA65_08935 [Pseudomonadota bacterium]